MIGSGACLIDSSSRNCKHITVVSVGEFCCYHTAAFHVRFNYHSGVTQASYDPVSQWEMMLVWFCAAKEFTQYSSTCFHHFLCETGVFIRIHFIQPMTDHTNSW